MSEMATADAILSTATAVESPASATQGPDSSQQVTDGQPADQQTVEAVDSPQDTPGDRTPGEQGGGDGAQKLPTTQQIRQALKAFRDANPEHLQAAKLLNDGYSRYEAYKSVFPDVETARTVKAQLDTIGGMEGLASLQSTVASIEETDSLIESGDPAVLDQVIEDSPEGFKKLAPHYLTKLEKLDPEAFTATIQPHFVKALIESNFPQVVSYLEGKLSDKPELQAVVKSMKEWFTGQQQQAEKFKLNLANPEQEKVKEGWKQLEQERRKDFESQVSTGVSSHIQSELGSKLRSYSESLNSLAPAMRQAVARACIETLGQALKTDKAYQAQISAMMGGKKPDRAKVIAFNKEKVSLLAPRVIESVVKSFGLKPNAGKPGPKPGDKLVQGAQNVPKTIVKVQSAPKDADIDWNHPNMSTEAFIRGRAVLKNGQFVAWK